MRSCERPHKTHNMYLHILIFLPPYNSRTSYTTIHCIILSLVGFRPDPWWCGSHLGIRFPRVGGMGRLFRRTFHYKYTVTGALHQEMELYGTVAIAYRPRIEWSVYWVSRSAATKLVPDLLPHINSMLRWNRISLWLVAAPTNQPVHLHNFLCAGSHYVQSVRPYIH